MLLEGTAEIFLGRAFVWFFLERFRKFFLERGEFPEGCQRDILRGERFLVAVFLQVVRKTARELEGEKEKKKLRKTEQRALRGGVAERSPGRVSIRERKTKEEEERQTEREGGEKQSKLQEVWSRKSEVEQLDTHLVLQERGVFRI